MKLSDFDYHLPQELIAQRPLKKRDSSRLLVIDRKNGKISHGKFTDIIGCLKEDDCVILNDTKVEPVRFIGRKPTGGRVDVLLLKKTGRDKYDCLLKANRPIRPGTKIELVSEGMMPLPPYIKRMPDKKDLKTYQTVFARRPGAVAAPTAGLHFTKGLLAGLKKKGIKAGFITLHVGYGTFKPVTEENIVNHKMHSEWFEISKKTANLVNKTRAGGGRILAVGTTVCRSLESSSFLRNTQYAVRSTKRCTNLFIYPGYKFKMTDMLLTNFHLPRTTLLMLVAAFCGRRLLFKAYKEAIKKRYRFFSYGDTMFII